MRRFLGLVGSVFGLWLLVSARASIDTLPSNEAWFINSAGVFLLSMGVVYVIRGIWVDKLERSDRPAAERESAEPEVRPVVEEEIDEDDDSSDISEEQPVLVSDDSVGAGADQAETETPVVVETKLEKDRRESVEEARQIAAEKWSVSRVVVVFAGKPEIWRALVMIRALDGSASRSLEILGSHRHYEEFFALDEGEVVEFTCEGENFETGDFSTTIPEDFLRIVMPLRSADKAKQVDEVEGGAGITDGGFI